MVNAERGVSRRLCADALTGYVLEPKRDSLDTGPLCYARTFYVDAEPNRNCLDTWPLCYAGTFYVDADDTLTEAPKLLHVYMGAITCGTVTRLTLFTAAVFLLVLSRQAVRDGVGTHFLHVAKLMRMDVKLQPTPTLVVQR